MDAEDRVWVHGLATCRAARTRMTPENLARNISGLLGVIAADTTGHEEGVDEAENGRDAGPAEQEIEDAEAVAAEVELVDAKATKEDGEEDTDDLVAAGMLVLGVEPAALVVGHVGGVDGIRGLHIEYTPN